MIEKSLVLVKPDGVRRGLIGEIIKRFEQRGLQLIGMKLIHIDINFAKKHYTEDVAKRRGENVRNWLLEYITEGPVVAMVIEGINAVELVRKIAGTTEPKSALPGTIRGDFAHISFGYADKKKKPIKNLIHASGNKKEAEHEINLWFSDSELFKYKTNHHEDIF